MNAIKILFISANPTDQTRLNSEFDEIRGKLKICIEKDELEFLLPIWDTDYEKLLLRLKEDHPNVLHYSGHGFLHGIILKNNVTGNTQLLENEELKDIFEGRDDYLKLVLLNSCFSAIQAKIISEQGIYVLGMTEAIPDDIAKELAERFYLGFTVQENPIKIERAIKIGCTNFVKTYPNYGDLISLWKDGEEITYKSL